VQRIANRARSVRTKPTQLRRPGALSGYSQPSSRHATVLISSQNCKIFSRRHAIVTARSSKLASPTSRCKSIGRCRRQFSFLDRATRRRVALAALVASKCVVKHHLRHPRGENFRVLSQSANRADGSSRRAGFISNITGGRCSKPFGSSTARFKPPTRFGNTRCGGLRRKLTGETSSHRADNRRTG